MLHFPLQFTSTPRALLAALAGALALALAPARAEERPQLRAGAVAVADKFSAAAAEDILRHGGNAVDAAVAVGFALAVTYPEAGNIGGGGFMTLYVDGKPYFLDYRERAPAAASRDMYLDAGGKIVPRLSVVGHKASGVPGTVMGLWEAHRRFGKLSWKQVMAPAMRYAHDGFVVDAQLAARRDTMLTYLEGKTNFAEHFGGMRAGELFRQPLLDATLKRIAADGPKGFYEGRTAGQLIAEMARNEGLISARDLSDYRAVWREPITARWKGYQVITAPPPSSGGVGLVQLLKMKEKLSAAFSGVPHNSVQYVHLLAELEKRVFADRAEYLGDPDFYQVPLRRLTDDAYLAKRSAEVSLDKPSPTPDIRPGLPESEETTHYSIVDQWGNAVSNTYTLNGRFGSGVVVGGAGFLLNNQMDDFSSKPGEANKFGVVGKDANAIAPGKRMLSSMSPTILTRDGKVALVIGTPGGSRIFTSVFQVISGLYDFQLPLSVAVGTMRVHHQLFPADTLFWEQINPPGVELRDGLTARGYNWQAQPALGDIQAIQIVGDTPVAVSDPRGRGWAQLVK